MAGSGWLTIDRLIGDHRLHAIVVLPLSFLISPTTRNLALGSPIPYSISLYDSVHSVVSAYCKRMVLFLSWIDIINLMMRRENERIEQNDKNKLQTRYKH